MNPSVREPARAGARSDRTLRSPAVEALLHYTRNDGVRPRNYTFEPPAGTPRSTGEADARRVRVRDGRGIAELTLDVAGFELLAHRSHVRSFEDFQDPAQVRAQYYPEVDALLRTRTGASKVVIFDHTLRESTGTHATAGTRAGVRADSPALREPVRRVHDDQTFDSAPKRVERHLPADEARTRLQRRFAIINVWRPIGAPVQRDPLALCDARSIDMRDLIVSELVYPDWTGETYAVAHAARHRWYYFPRQSPAEVTLIKVYDSATDGTARLTAHTAFEDPTTPSDAPPRRSIEVRALVFW